MWRKFRFFLIFFNALFFFFTFLWHQNLGGFMVRPPFSFSWDVFPAGNEGKSLGMIRNLFSGMLRVVVPSPGIHWDPPGISFRSQILWDLFKSQPCLGGDEFHEPGKARSDPRVSQTPAGPQQQQFFANLGLKIQILAGFGRSGVWSQRGIVSLWSAGNGNGGSGN